MGGGEGGGGEWGGWGMGGGESVVVLVRSRNHLLNRGELLDHLDGSKDLLLADLHIIGHLAEDGRLHKIAAIAELPSTCLKFSAFSHSRLNIGEHLLLLLANLSLFGSL